LKNALTRWNLSHLIPDNIESGFSYGLNSYLQNLVQQSTLEDERKEAVLNSIRSQTSSNPDIQNNIRQRIPDVKDNDDIKIVNVDYKPLLSLDEIEMKESESEITSLPSKDTTNALPTNVFDIERGRLLNEIARLRENLFSNRYSKKINIENKHNLPISDMGDFHELLKKNPPLRDVLPPVFERKHQFGNPFIKKSSKSNKIISKLMSVDEAVDFGKSETSEIRGKRKQKDEEPTKRNTVPKTIKTIPVDPKPTVPQETTISETSPTQQINDFSKHLFSNTITIENRKDWREYQKKKGCE